MQELSFHETASYNRFLSGNETFNLLGAVSLQIPTQVGVPVIYIKFDFVQADIPALIGMDVLDREHLIADTIFNRLDRCLAYPYEGGSQVYVDEWYIRLIRSSSWHLYRYVLVSLESAT